MEQQTIAALFVKYLNNACSPAEVERLMALMEDPANEEIQRELIRLQLGAGSEAAGYTSEALQEQLGLKLRDILAHTHPQPARVIKLSTLRWRIAAAACVLLLFGTPAYFIILHKSAAKIGSTENRKKGFKNDVAPGGSKATLTLGNGKKIILDSAANGTLASQGNTKILKLTNGQLTYNGLNGKPSEVVYNTLTTPPGGQYQLVLPDGSKVWLDAASSITYPTAFVGASRKVAITGQAYFEVAKNKALPFIVEKGEMRIEVLGTHFNVNAYEDEGVFKTTLLEGSVKVSAGPGQAILAPGQQLELAKNGSLKLIRNADVEEAVAWKNGFFRFNRSDVKTVMRQLSRWYDVEIIYEGNIPQQQFGGKMERDLNLSEVLDGLEKSLVHFRIEGKKLIVMP